jgi:hypothetical protein
MSEENKALKSNKTSTISTATTGGYSFIPNSVANPVKSASNFIFEVPQSHSVNSPKQHNLPLDLSTSPGLGGDTFKEAARKVIEESLSYLQVHPTTDGAVKSTTSESELMIQKEARFSPAKIKKAAAILASVFAITLAVNHVLGGNLNKQAAKFTAMITNSYDFLQSKTTRQAEYKIALRDLEVRLAANPKISGNARELIESGIKEYKGLIALSDSDPQTKEGKLEVLQRARALENARDSVLARAPWFDYSQGAFGAAIAVLLICLVAGIAGLFWLGLGLGVLGYFCLINGVFLFITI